MSNARVQATAEGMPKLRTDLSPLKRMQALADAWLSAPAEFRDRLLALTERSDTSEASDSGETFAANAGLSPEPPFSNIRREPMQTPSVQAAAEGMHPSTPRALVFLAENDMRKVFDLALIVHEHMNGVNGIEPPMQAALSWLSCELVDIGERLAHRFDAIFAASLDAERGRGDGTIPALFARWMAIRNEEPPASEEQGNERHARYVALQEQITESKPHTAQEFAMQLYVETDAGDSEYRPEWFAGVSRTALGLEDELKTASEQLQTIKEVVFDGEGPAERITGRFATAYGTFQTELAAYNAAEDPGDVHPIEQRFIDAVIEPVRLATNDEAAILLNHVLASESSIDTFDAKLVGAVLDYLEGMGGVSSRDATEVPHVIADPMLDLVRRFNLANEFLNQSDIETDADVDAYCKAHFDPLLIELEQTPPAVATREGAIEALRLAATAGRLDGTEVALGLNRAVLVYLESEAAK